MCEAEASTTKSSSSEMSERPWSNSEIEWSEGGVDDREDEEEKERGNMKIDWRRKIRKEGGSVGGKTKSDPYGHSHIEAGSRNKSGSTNEPMHILNIISVL